MSRTEKTAVVEAFLDAMVRKDLADLPADADLTVESPLTPPLRGAAAMEYLKRVAAGLTAVRIKQHIVEGDWVATSFDEETVHGELAVFYDPRRLTGSK